MDVVFGSSLPSGCIDVPDVAEWLATQGLTTGLVVVFLPEQRAIVALNLGKPEPPIRVPLIPPRAQQFAFADLENLLQRFYIHGVSTHRGHCRIWEDEKKRRLRPEPERTVQGALFLFLLGCIEIHHQGVVRVEVYHPKGRDDIEIIRSDHGKYKVGILELKVLSPKKSQKANLDWALKGIQQVLAYSATYNTASEQIVDAKYVCCFDGRKSDTPMPEFFSTAATAAVQGRRYFMETPGVSREHTTFLV
jgi:hypothetical protein